MILDPVLDTAPCGFVRLADDGTMIAVNQTLAAALGYARADLQGWHLQKILPAGGRVFYNTHVFPLLRMHGAAEEVYLPLRTHDGQAVPMLLNARRHLEGHQEVNDCILVRMIQRHEFEDELVHARRAAEAASASKDRFLSIMSHELRTPLTAIAGYAQLLERVLVDRAEAEYATTIGHAARDVSRLIDDVLSFAQLESGRVAVSRTTVPMPEAINRAAMLVRPRLEESGVSFETSGCEGVAARADGDRLQQILLNLLGNAIKFTPPGGRVDMRCEARDRRVRIIIADSGTGIPEDQMERIFEPFVQLDAGAVAGGVGLGLAISRDLARAMDGDITAAWSQHGGASFIVDLPAAEATSGAPTVSAGDTR